MYLNCPFCRRTAAVQKRILKIIINKESLKQWKKTAI
jgi:hypothetical protein